MQEPGKIRNVAIVGHRGTGKTSLLEAMLFQAGAINRLGTVEAGTTVGDWDEDEQRRQMSLAASLALFAGLVFIGTAAVLVAPWVHWLLHRLHSDLPPEK